MELTNIENLINKYLNAETTLKEEKILREYFTSNNVASHLQEFGILFEYYKQNQSEKLTKSVKLNTKDKQKRSFQWMSVAASVVLLVSSVFIGKQEYEKHQQRKQLAQIKEALKMVSYQLNKGNDMLYAVSDNINKGNKAIKQIHTFPKTMHTANNILKVK